MQSFLHFDLSLKKPKEDEIEAREHVRIGSGAFRLVGGAECVKSVDLSRNFLDKDWPFFNCLSNMFQSLEVLDLSGNRLRSLPSAVSLLGKLREIDVSNNLLKAIPYSLKYPKSGRLLEKVVLDGNCLTELSACNARQVSVRNNNIRVLTIDLYYCERLEVLDLSENPITTLDNLQLLRQLRVLHIDMLKLNRFPVEIQKLRQLRELHARHNAFTSIPQFLGSLRLLKHLDVSQNLLESLPGDVGMNVERLDISSNYFKSIPCEVLASGSIRELIASNNSMSAILPADSAKSAKCHMLRSLEYLDLSNNQIEKFPMFLCECAFLCALNLSHNIIETIPAEIHLFKALNILNLSHNAIRRIPDQLFTLKTLVSLDLSSNTIGHLPNNICSLDSLKTLDLRSCGLEELNPDVFKPGQLEYLGVSNNSIGSLPASIEDLGDLRSLDASACSLTQIPEQISKLSKLRHINLSSNFIGSGLEHLCLLPLESLDLEANNISDVTPKIGALSSLLVLNLSFNRLFYLPSSIGNMRSLRELVCEHNKLRELPEELSRLPSLARVDLGHNQIKAIPCSFGNLTGLKYLNLCNNRISSIPESLGDLDGLREINLNNNQIVTFPRRVLGAFVRASGRGGSHAIELHGNPLVDYGNGYDCGFIDMNYCESSGRWFSESLMKERYLEDFALEDVLGRLDSEPLSWSREMIKSLQARPVAHELTKSQVVCLFADILPGEDVCQDTATSMFRELVDYVYPKSKFLLCCFSHGSASHVDLLADLLIKLKYLKRSNMSKGSEYVSMLLQYLTLEHKRAMLELTHLFIVVYIEAMRVELGESEHCDSFPDESQFPGDPPVVDHRLVQAFVGLELLALKNEIMNLVVTPYLFKDSSWEQSYWRQVLAHDLGFEDYNSFGGKSTESNRKYNILHGFYTKFNPAFAMAYLAHKISKSPRMMSSAHQLLSAHLGDCSKLFGKKPWSIKREGVGEILVLLRYLDRKKSVEE